MATISVLNNINESPVWLDKSIVQYKKTLHVVKPCQDVIRIQERGRPINVQFLHAITQICNEQYKEEIQPLLRDMSQCHPKPDSIKRDIMVDLLTLAGSAVYNFFRSRSMPETDSRDSMITSFYKSYSQQELFDIDSSRFVSSYSPSSTHHLSEIEQQQTYLKPLIWSIAGAQAEMIAGGAMFRVITQYCMRGRVATIELAELLDDEELSFIDSAETNLLWVQSYNDNMSFRFVYQVQSKKFRKPIDLAAILVITLGAICLLYFLFRGCIFRSTCRVVIARDENDNLRGRKKEMVQGD